MTTPVSRDSASFPELVAAHEVAHMLGVTRQRVSQLAARPGFPQPVAILHCGRIWIADDITLWARNDGRPMT